jgi:hypothetical protein
MGDTLETSGFHIDMLAMVPAFAAFGAALGVLAALLLGG